MNVNTCAVVNTTDSTAWGVLVRNTCMFVNTMGSRQITGILQGRRRLQAQQKCDACQGKVGLDGMLVQHTCGIPLPILEKMKEEQREKKQLEHQKLLDLVHAERLQRIFDLMQSQPLPSDPAYIPYKGVRASPLGGFEAYYKPVQNGKVKIHTRTRSCIFHRRARALTRTRTRQYEC